MKGNPPESNPKDQTMRIYWQTRRGLYGGHVECYELFECYEVNGGQVMRPDDLISKSVLLAEVDGSISDLAFTSPYQDEIERLRDGMERVRDYIESAPTIDPEELRPKGRWEMRGGKLYCTHCGKRAAVARDSDDFWYTKGTPACPNCGAKMEAT